MKEGASPSGPWKKELAYITRYAGSGVVNTLAGFIVIFAAMALGFSPLISNVSGYAVGFLFGFVLSRKFVFRSDGHFVAESFRYLGAFVASFLVNLLVLRVALLSFDFPPTAAQLCAVASYTLLMYTLSRLFVFAGTSRKK